MFKNKKSALITIGIVLVILAIASRFVNLVEIAGVLSKADFALLIAALIFELAALCLKTLRWQELLSEVKQVDFFQLLKIQIAGTAISNLTPARIGETSKSLYLEKHGVKKRFSLLTILWERLFDLVAIIVFSTLVVSTYGSALLVVLVLIIGAVIATHHAGKITAFLSGIKRLSFLGDFALHKFRKTTLLKSLAITFAAWLLDLLAVALAFRAVGVELPFAHIMGAFAISLIVGIISTVPGGFGTIEASLYLLFKDTYPATLLGAAFVAARLVTIVWIFILGAISAVMLEQKN